MVSHNLKHDGLWIARELVEPNGAPKPVDRNACGKKESDPSDPLNKFIKRVFDVSLTQAVIDEFEQTKWIKTPTYSRKSVADYQKDVPNDLRPMGTIPVTSDKLFNSENPRIFNTFGYQKE